MRNDALDPAVDRLIARLLIGKPHIRLADLRQLIPDLREMDDHSLTQKVEYLRKKGPGLTATTRQQR